MRLVRSTSEMEGRVTEVWTLVDPEDDLEPWRPGTKLDSVGKPAPRQDGHLRAMGVARYTVDIQLAGMLHAAVLRSPVAHARVTNLRLDAAAEFSGVRAVIGPNSETLLGTSTTASALLTSEPVYAGQPIALVAADSQVQAELALEALDLELEVATHIVDPSEAVRDLRLAADPYEDGRGETDVALASADVSIELAFETPDHLQTPLEPHGAVARWDAETLTVWLSTQGMFDARRELAAAFGLSQDRVRVRSEFIGGGFGSKQGAGFEAIAAAELARVTRRPVRLVNNRHAEQLDGGRRARSLQTVRLGAQRDGSLVAIEAEAVIDQGHGGSTYFSGLVLAPAVLLYRCENVRVMGVQAKTHRRGQNAFRAPGTVEGTAAFEQAIDELAIALEMDPLELRRLNHVDHDQSTGLPYSGKRLLACYDRAAELAGWSSRAQLLRPHPDGLQRGMGCASQIWWGSGGPPAHATVRIDASGHAEVATGIQDIGTGTLTAAQLVAAEELGLPVDQVRVVGGDTARNLYGPVAGGSMTVPSVMPAVRSASAKARRLLLQLASDVLELSSADVELRNGRIRSLDGALDVPVTDVTQKLGDATIDASGSRGPNPADVAVQTFGCQIAQVAIDAAVGEVVVERIVAVHDVGRIVNPLAAASQVEGGVLQGMAFALSEELIVDPTTGTPVNAHLDDYKVPTIADSPEIVVDFIDLPDERLSNVGSRGLGEPPIIPTAAAIGNAFAHATGKRCAAFPMTRSRVLDTLA